MERKVAFEYIINVPNQMMNRQVFEPLYFFGTNQSNYCHLAIVNVFQIFHIQCNILIQLVSLSCTRLDSGYLEPPVVWHSAVQHLRPGQPLLPAQLGQGEPWQEGGGDHQQGGDEGRGAVRQLWDQLGRGKVFQREEESSGGRVWIQV